MTCSRYIELNPVRADMVKGPGEYRWSSYRVNALGCDDRNITPHELYLRLGETREIRQTNYRALFRSKGHWNFDRRRLICSSYDFIDPNNTNTNISL